MPFPKSPPAPPAPTGASAGGSPGVGVAVTFPDGNMAILSAQTFIFPDQATSKVIVGVPGTPLLTYICTDAAEMYSIINQINEAVASGASQLVLASTAAIPLQGDITVSPSGGTVQGGDTVYLSVPTPGSGAKPTKGAFHQGGTVRFGGVPARMTLVLNSFSVVCITPPGLVTGSAIAVSFYDDHGGVDKPAAFTYS